MGRLSAWVGSWRETYAEYPGATLLAWTELLVGALLVPAALLYPAFADRLPWSVGLALAVVGAAFVVWFTTVRRPVMDRLL